MSYVTALHAINVSDYRQISSLQKKGPCSTKILNNTMYFLRRIDKNAYNLLICIIHLSFDIKVQSQTKLL